MDRIRYKYRKSKQGVQLVNVKCPVCNNPINWQEVVSDIRWNGTTTLLAECWSGSISKEMPRHLFYIKIRNLPNIEIDLVKKKKLAKYEEKLK